MSFEKTTDPQIFDPTKIFVLCPCCGMEALYSLPRTITVVRCFFCEELIPIHHVKTSKKNRKHLHNGTRRRRFKFPKERKLDI